ncbi:MAG TPA: tetratricopeptide repeat protein [Candidatus Polarisedimenticolia bacterium]|nr:tetratricopeptide repeat protein [Candidatus Polarisedimenticolia bacterium]
MTALPGLRRRTAILLGLAALAALVYAPSLANDFTYDDIDLVDRNPAVTGDGGLSLIFRSSYWYPDDPDRDLYRPLTIASYWLNFRLFGPGATAYHAVNVLLHAAVTVLLFLVFSRLAGQAAAAAAAVLFAAHPIHAEAVVGVVGRAELLAALFVLAAWLMRDRPLTASLSCLAGLLSKENAIVLPGLMVIEDLLPGSRGRGPGRRAVQYAAVAAAVAVYLAMRVGVLGYRFSSASGPFSGVDPAHRVGTAIDVIGRYLLLMVWPARLSADYEFDQIPIVVSTLDPGLLAGAAAAACLIAAGWAARRRMPGVCAGVAIFFVSFAPVSNLPFGIGVVMAERLMYLPSAGVCLAAGAALAAMAERAGRLLGGLQPAAASCLAALVLALPLGARAWVRTADWRDQLTLFEATVRTSPRSLLARFGLAHTYHTVGRHREAEAEYRRALAIAPGHARTHYNLGTLLEATGRQAEAIASYAEAARLDPSYAEAHHNLGVLLEKAGRAEEAVRAFRRAVEARHTNAASHYGLASVLEKGGDVDGAIASYRAAIELEPDDLAALNDLGRLLLAQGRPGEAVELLERAVRTHPDAVRARVNLGAAWLAKGEPGRAAALARQVLERHPADEAAARLLAAARRSGADDPRPAEAPR